MTDPWLDRWTALRDHHEAKASAGINPEAHEDLAWQCDRAITALEKQVLRYAQHPKHTSGETA